jgi:hypothetical protein
MCVLCMHAKMVASSHPPLINVMTEHPCELLHMDLVGPACGHLVYGKWYVLMVSLGMPGFSIWRKGGGVWFRSRSCLEVKE